MRYFQGIQATTTALLLLACTPVVVCAQFPSEATMHMMAPEYEAEAVRLREAPPQKYDFSKATLSDVLRFLATDANISFFSLPDDSADGSKLITFSIEASPFRVLETLCKANGLAIIPDNGIWYIRPADDRELIGKAYEIKHNALERVDYSSNGSSLSGSPAGGGGGGGGGKGGSSGVSLQGVGRSFSVKRSELINSIRSLLGLPPEELEQGALGGSAAMAASVQGQDPVRDMNSNTLSATRKPKVIWQSDSNTLYIVATRLQHMWVEGYLASADQPQQLIAIEVKFIETSRDPKREFGIDWTGSLETGTFREVSKVSPTIGTYVDGTGATRSYNSNNIEFTQVPTNGGYRLGLAPLLDSLDTGNIPATLGWPALSVLSAQDLNVRLRAIMRDDNTNTTSYPRMVTLNNREVAIRSVVNQPVLDSSATSTGGGGGAAVATTQIAYLPIGTVLHILPKKMADEKVLLNMDITVSSIIGETMISGNPYPIASSRVYNAPVEVNSGYTVAVGGLDEAREKEGEAGVPFLEKIPGLKWLFKYRSRSKNHKNLMLFITPNLIDARDGGLPNEPQSVVPQRPDRYLPKKPRVDYHTGALAGGVNDLPNASRYLSREADKLENSVNESLITEETGQKLRELKTATEQVITQCQQLKLSHPGDFATIDQNELVLKGILDRVSRITRTMFSKKYF